MPSEKELREETVDMKSFKKYLSYDKELLLKENSPLDLTENEKKIKEMIDSEIEKMVKIAFLSKY